MSGLKLSIAAASIYTNPCKWVRTITTTTTTTTKPTVSFTRRILLSFNNCKGRSITPCAPFSPAAHVSLPSCIKDINNKDLGFRFSNHKCFSSSSSSSSSQDKGGLSGSSGTGLVADMGQENDVKADHDGWYHDDRLLRQNQSPLSSPSQQQQHQSSKFLTLPTVLTLGRVAAVPLLVATFYIDSWWGRTATTSIFTAAAITDWLDGYLARKMRLGSAFGAFLDPVADKLMVAATLVLLCTRPLEVAMFGQVPWLLTVPSIAIIGREPVVSVGFSVGCPCFWMACQIKYPSQYEITMSAVREWAAAQNSKLLEAVAVNNLGKWKTATQMTALTIILATRDSSLGGPGLLVASGVVLLYISAGLSLWSLAVYMRKIWKVLLK